MKNNLASKEFKLEKKDMQCIISRGYKELNAAAYIFLQIIEADEAKKYFKRIEKYITPADLSNRSDLTPKGDPLTAVHIAFTHTGLKELGLEEGIRDTFSREFIEGMSFSDPKVKNPQYNEERSKLLGDTTNNHPSNWIWGNSTKEVHCVLMLFAEKRTELHKLMKEVYADAFKEVDQGSIKGVKKIYMPDIFEYDPKISKEHFGFNDGIAQPLIKGLSKADSATAKSFLNPGEFILGYPNQYNDYSPSPYVPDDVRSRTLSFSPKFPHSRDLGKNGSYMVFRQMEQHVETFWHYMYNASKETAPTKASQAVKLGSKMVGRWPNGDPIVLSPDGGCPIHNKSQDDFLYSGIDENGIKCPFGAHIRRTNPRDQVHTGRDNSSSLDVTAKHRMLRRGRIYGEPLKGTNFEVEKMISYVEQFDCEGIKKIKRETIGGTRGLHFICIVSDIQRQFEFVQNVWANTSTFGDLCNEVDPLISPRPTKGEPHCHEFSTPQSLIRNRYKNVPEFTTVVGGAYFFLPGIKALQYIIT
jgi:Dyp-type peroxidase family